MQSDRIEATGKENKTLIEEISESNGCTFKHVAVSSDCEMKMDVSRLVDDCEVPHDSKGHGEETLKPGSKTESLNDAKSPNTSLNDSLQSDSISLYLSSSNESLNKDVSQKVPVKKNELCKEQRRFSLDAARLTLKEFFEFPEVKHPINSDFEVGLDMKELFSNISIPSDNPDFVPPRYVESSYIGAHESCDNRECLCKEYDTLKNTESIQSPRHLSYRECATQESSGKRKYNEDSFKECENMCPNSSLSLNTENQIVTGTNFLTDLQPKLAMEEQSNNLNLELLASTVLDFQQSHDNLPNRDALPCFELLWDEMNFHDYDSKNRSMKKNSLPDDEFFEADRYTGDKGKQPASKKYAYKKKSKSSQKQASFTSEGESAEKSNSESAWDFPGTSGINCSTLPSTSPGSPESNNIPCPVPKENQFDYTSNSGFKADKRVTASGWSGRLIRETTHQLSRQTSSDSTTAENGEITPQLPPYEDALNLDSTDEGKQLQMALLLSLQDVKAASSDEDS